MYLYVLARNLCTYMVISNKENIVCILKKYEYTAEKYGWYNYDNT